MADAEGDDLAALFGGAAPAPSQEAAMGLDAAVGKAIELQAWIDEGEEAIKRAKQELHVLTNRIIPDAMAEAHTLSWTHESGWKVEMKDILSGSLPKEEVPRSIALKWLRDNDYGDLIKNKLTVEFEKGGDNLAAQVKGALDELEVPYEIKEDVHAMSLQALARERLREAAEVPLDTLGLYAGRQAKLSEPKVKKSRSRKSAA